MVKGKPVVAPSSDLPITDPGFEKIEVAETIKPTQSTYEFEDYRVTVQLSVTGVARNLNYSTVAGNPPYSVSWTLIQQVVKATT